MSTYVTRQIVPQWSAMLQGVESQDLSCTHSELPKFKDPSESRFETFWGEVQLLVQKADTNNLHRSICTYVSQKQTVIIRGQPVVVNQLPVTNE
jgi:hypothetical protein